MAEDIQGKHSLELNFVDTRVFLNYWDYHYGQDVIAEIIDGQLYTDEEEITFEEFVNRVKKTIRARNKT